MRWPRSRTRPCSARSRGRIVDEDLTRDAAAEAVREAVGKPSRKSAEPGQEAKGRGGQPARGSVRVFKVNGAKLALTFPRKVVRDEEVLAALEEAAGQVRALLGRG